MIDTLVTVTCGFMSDEDSCESEFEVNRIGLPADLPSIVDQQLVHRGWTGSSAGGPVTCPLHRAKE